MVAQDTPALRISADTEGGTTLLRLVGELDLATADLLRERVRPHVTGRSAPELTLDLGGLEFLDVTGLGAILETRRKVVAAGGSLSLRRPRPMVVRMLSLLSLEEALHVEDDSRQA